jgi:hypothetical protein
LSLGWVAGGVAFNLFIVSLLLIWRSSYYCSALEKTRGLVIGHALLMLSAGIGLAVLGVNAALANNCEVFMSGNKPDGLRNQFAIYLQSVGYCRELGLGVILLGSFMAYPSVCLFVGKACRSSEPPSASA